MDRFQEQTPKELERETKLEQLETEYKERYESIRDDMKTYATSCVYEELSDIQFVIGELEDVIEQLKEVQKEYKTKAEEL